MEGTIGRKLPQRPAVDPLGPSREATSTKQEPTSEGTITSGVDTIAGRYKLKEILGRGGVGVVYRANDMELGEEIAIKVLQGQATRNAADLERFKREIITARKITHANVIRIHDFGMSGDEAFISMELLGGGTLADKIEDGPMAIKPGLEIAIGICEGLEAAHQMGIIHRDIKPDNVIFDVGGRPKLVDFGLARLASAPTRTIGFSGTPFYVSPEQAEGGEVTGRSDIYSLGVLLFEMFTGRLPFLADNLVRLAILHANEPPPTPRSVRPDLSPVLEAVILRCLQKDALVRYATAAEVAVDLRAVRDGKNPPGLAKVKEANDKAGATLIRSMPPPEPTRPMADNKAVDRVATGSGAIPRVPTGERERVSGRVPTPAPIPAAPTSARTTLQTGQRAAPSFLDEPPTEPRPTGKSNGTILLALGGGATLILGLTAVMMFGGFGFGAGSVPATPTPFALGLTPTPAQTVATETIGLPTPDETQPVVTAASTATPRSTRTPAAASTKATPAPTTSATKVAVAPTPKVIDVDFTAPVGRGSVRFIAGRVLGKNKYPYVRCMAVGLKCAETATKVLPLPAGSYPVELYDPTDKTCSKPAVASGGFEVKDGTLTEVTLNDSGTGIRSSFTAKPK